MFKPTHTYKQKDTIEIHPEYKVYSKKCTKISITYLIDASHILMALEGLIELNFNHDDNSCTIKEKKITKKEIEEQVKYLLGTCGQDYFTNRSQETWEDYDKIKLQEAIKIAQKYYPEFMGVSPAKRFMEELIKEKKS